MNEFCIRRNLEYVVIVLSVVLVLRCVVCYVACCVALRAFRVIIITWTYSTKHMFRVICVAYMLRVMVLRGHAACPAYGARVA